MPIRFAVFRKFATLAVVLALVVLPLTGSKGADMKTTLLIVGIAIALTFVFWSGSGTIYIYP